MKDFPITEITRNSCSDLLGTKEFGRKFPVAYCKGMLEDYRKMLGRQNNNHSTSRENKEWELGSVVLS